MSDDQKIQTAIKKYLRQNPGFFAANPALLNEMEVADESGQLTSLTTHQLRSLQKENRQLKNQIQQLIHNAQQSESLMNRLFELLIQLSTSAREAFIPGFVRFVGEHFPSDYLRLWLAEGLVDADPSEQVDVITAEIRTQFSVFQAKPEPLSGRLKQEKIHSIFKGVDDIKSAIVLPIGPQAQFGLMAFASTDEEKFHPTSASDILQKLTHILAHYLTQSQAQDENQAMS